MNGRFRFENLPNRLVNVEDRESGLVGLWERSGRPRSGDLTNGTAAGLIGRAIAAANGYALSDPADPIAQMGHTAL